MRKFNVTYERLNLLFKKKETFNEVKINLESVSI